VRPAGEISTAILTAAARLARVELVGDEQVRRGPTLRELAHSACVGMNAARDTVANLRRHGKLEPVAERRVEYRNRPVVEYAPSQRVSAQGEMFDLQAALASWTR
jgi:hypothetical protein